MTTNPPTATEIITCVRRGADWLDAEYPKWVREIKIEEIDLTDPETSPAAQVLGEDWDTKFTMKVAVALGFLVPHSTEAAIELANKTWRGVVRARRQAKQKASA